MATVFLGLISRFLDKSVEKLYIIPEFDSKKELIG